MKEKEKEKEEADSGVGVLSLKKLKELSHWVEKNMLRCDCCGAKWGDGWGWVPETGEWVHLDCLKRKPHTC